MSVRSLQLMAGSPAGGAETFYVTLGVALKKAGFDVHFGLRAHEDREAALKAAGAPLQTFPFGRWDIGTALGLRRYIREIEPDVVMTWMNRAAERCPNGDFVKLARFGGYYDMKYYKHHDHVIGIVPGIVKYLKDCGWPEDRVHYVPNFSRVEDMAPADRAALDTPEDAPLLVALGRLHQAKGLDVLLHAMTDVPGAYLWIAGDGPLEGELKAQCTSLGLDGRVRFLGWRNDRTALLNAADMCVFPSRYEPNGTVTVEAWAHRKPLVAAASSGPAEMINHGKDGMLVPIDDAKGLAQAINQVLTDKTLAAEIVGNGYERFEAQFTEKAVVETYRHLYEHLVRTR